MLSNTEKEQKIIETQKLISVFQYDYNSTQSNIAKLLNRQSGGKLKLTKSDISKIQSGKVKFDRSIDKLLLINRILVQELKNIRQNKSNNSENKADKNNQITDFDFFAREERKDAIKFSLFSLFVDKIFPGKYQLVWVYVFFTFLSPAILSFWAFKTGVWTGIDYPLKESYSTWLGELVLSLINILILRYYDEMGYLLHFETKFQEKTKNYFRQFLFLIFSILISFYFHKSFTKDNIFGWCEGNSGSLSVLGYYHILIFGIQIWIIFDFIVNIYFTAKIITALNENPVFQTNRLLLYKKGIVKKLSNIILIYAKILLTGGVYALIFLYTVYRFIELRTVNNIPLDTGALELIAYVIIYMFLGIGFFWFFIIKPVINLLEKSKQMLVSQYPENHRILSLKLLPFDENPFQYVFLSFCAILCIVTISIAGILLINRIVDFL